MKNVIFDPEKLKKFCSDVCVAKGLSREAGDATADILVRTDMLGIYTHGVFGLAPYLAKMDAGGLDRNAVPEVVAEGPAWAIVDGHNAIGTYPAKFGLEYAIEKAKKSGVCYVGVKNSAHCGAPGIFAVEGAEKGMVTIACSNCPKNSTLPGTRGETFGNNPIAFAAPCTGRRPIFMDISCSTVAGTKIRRKVAAGEKTIPAGWAVDEMGRPTTDATLPNLYMTFFSQHKGYCLALLVETITAILSGGALINQSKLWLIPDAVPGTSHAFIVFDAAQILGEELFADRMEATADEILASPKAEGSDGVVMPGDFEWAHYEKMLAEGLELPEDIAGDMAALAEKTGVDLTAAYKK